MQARIVLLVIYVLSSSLLIGQEPELVLPMPHGYNSSVVNVSFSADGKFFVTSTAESVKLWETKSRRQIKTLQLGDYPDNSRVSLATNPPLVLVGISPPYLGQTSYIDLWDPLDNRLDSLAKLEPKLVINHVSISHDAEYAMAVLHDSKNNRLIAQVWNTSSKKIIYEYSYQKENYRSYAPYLATFCADGEGLLIKDGQIVKTIDPETKDSIQIELEGSPELVHLAPDRTTLQVLTRSNHLQEWDMVSGKKMKSFELDRLSFPARSSFSQDGQTLTFFGDTRPRTLELMQYPERGKPELRVIQIETATGNRQTVNYPVDLMINPAGISPNGQLLVTARPRRNEFPDLTRPVAIDIKNEKVLPLAESKLATGRPNLFENSDLFYIPMGNAMDKDERFFSTNEGLKGLKVHIPDLSKARYFDIINKTCHARGQREPLWSLAEDDLEVQGGAFGPDGTVALFHDNTKVTVFDPSGKIIETYHNIPLERPGPKYTQSGYAIMTFDPYSHKLFSWSRFGGYDVYELETAAAPRPPTPEELANAYLPIPSKEFRVENQVGVYLDLIRKADSAKIATILPTSEDDWVISTPSGLFDGTEKGMESLHYVNGVEIIPLESYKARYWVPGLLDKLLAGKTAKEIRDVEALDYDELYPEIRAMIKQDKLSVAIKERSGGLGELNLYINGSLVNKNINPQQQSHVEIPLQPYAKHFYTQRSNQIQLQAFNKGDWMKSPLIDLPAYEPSFEIKRDHKLAHLYAVVVGTSEYAGEQLKLTYAGKDAVSIHKALTIAGQSLFQDRMDVRLYTTDKVPKDGSPSKQNIKKAIADIMAKAEPIDLVMLYFAGHGKALETAKNKPRFFYLTQDMNSFDQLQDPGARALSAIAQDTLTDWLGKIAARKKVMILDACNSGQIINSFVEGRDAFSESELIALDRMKDRTGMYILAGSAADKKSYETTQFGQGLLTYSLLSGMKELSAKHPNNEIDILQWLRYAEDEVVKLAQSVQVEQKPKMYSHQELSTFPIGILKDPAAIPLESIKPSIIQPLLLQEGDLYDHLSLTPRLERHIRKMIRRNSPFTFQDIRTSAVGYSIRGTYTIKGEAIVFNGHLWKGNKKVQGASISAVNGSINHPDDLVKSIFERIEFYIE